MKNQLLVLFCTALLFARFNCTVESLPPPLGCEEGSEADGSDRSYVQLNKGDFSADSIDQSLYDKANIWSVRILKALGHLSVSYTSFRALNGTQEQIWANIVRQDGTSVSKLAISHSENIKILLTLQNYLVFQSSAATNQKLYVTQFNPDFQSFTTAEYAYATAFQTSPGTAIVPTTAWDLIDIASQTNSLGRIVLIVVMKTPTGVYVGKSRTVNSSPGFGGYQITDSINVYCSRLELCLDIDSGALTDQSLSTVQTLNTSKTIDIWGLRYADEQTLRIQGQGSLVTEYDSDSKNSIFHFYDLTNSLIQTSSYTFTNSRTTTKNTHNSDFLEYDNIDIRYAYLSIVPGSTFPFTDTSIIINQVWIDSFFPILSPIIADGAIQRFSFSTSYLYMMTATKIIVVNKHIPASSDSQYVSISDQADFPISSELDVDSGISDWIDDPDTNFLAIRITCPCTTSGVVHMQCFQNSVCVFINTKVMGDCTAQLPSQQPQPQLQDG